MRSQVQASLNTSSFTQIAAPSSLFQLIVQVHVRHTMSTHQHTEAYLPANSEQAWAPFVYMILFQLLGM